MPISFHEVRLFSSVDYGVTGGPEYATDVTVTKTGLEQRNLIREEGRCKYTIAFGTIRPEKHQKLLAFFRARKGKTFGFRFKDWSDYKARAQLIGTGDGKTKVFQLTKTYADSAGKDVRKILKPVQNTVIIYLGSERAGNWTCNYATGQITFNSPPSQGLPITADFEFDIPVRFDIDQMAAVYTDFHNLSWQSITLVELLDE